MIVLALSAYLLAHGCSLACSAGIIGNLEIESGLDPASSSYGQVGLARWQGQRNVRLRWFCRPWQNAECQIRFIVQEAREIGLWDRLRGAADPGYAARLFAVEFERPRAGGMAWQRRAAAIRIYGQLRAAMPGAR